LFGEDLRPFEFGGGFGRSENSQITSIEFVNDACRKWDFGADYGQVNMVAGCKLCDLFDVLLEVVRLYAR